MRFELKASFDWGRVARILLQVVAVVLVLVIVRVVPLWAVAVYQQWVPYRITRQIAIGFLQVVRIAYGVLVVAVPLGLVFLSIRLARARQRGAIPLVSARLLLLCASTLVGFVLLEAAAAFWLAWVHRLPDLPTRFAAKAPNEIHLVVIGESSARGFPYYPWLSVGKIVAWQLERALPGRTVHLEELTGNGICLEQAILLLDHLKHRPDAVVVYAGHNEFQARFAWLRNVRHYADEQLARRRYWLLDRLVKLSPFCSLIEETIDIFRVGDPPPPHVTRQVVDHPAFTATEYAFLRSEFHRRMEGVVAYCERIGALPILIIPPGKEGDCAPFRSYLSANTTKPERDRFADEIWAARSLELTDPAQAVTTYRSLLARQPTFSEAHFRLARLLERAGAWDEAARHYLLARDFDGMPMRCPSDFQSAYRSAAQRHNALLIDGPAVLRRLSPHGILDAHLLQDDQHPSLRGYMALAQEVLKGLRARRAFGWPESTPAPRLDPGKCAAHFGLDATKWATVCERTALFYGRTAFMRYDPTANLARDHFLVQAAQRIKDGEPPEAVGVTGMGVNPAGIRVPDAED
jgi:hypothetical protein